VQTEERGAYNAEDEERERKAQREKSTADRDCNDEEVESGKKVRRNDADNSCDEQAANGCRSRASKEVTRRSRPLF
jgi:hypothetical protein